MRALCSGNHIHDTLKWSDRARNAAELKALVWMLQTTCE